MSLCFQSWIKLRFAFLVICFPCCVLGLIPIFVVFLVSDINNQHKRSALLEFNFLD